MRWLCTGDSWVEQCYLLKIDDDDMRWLATEDSLLEQFYLLKIADELMRWVSTEMTDWNRAIY